MPVKKLLIFLIPFFIFFTVSCGKKDVAGEPVITDSVGRINKWIYDSMRYYYYWNISIPSRPDYSLSTAAFFRSLLSSQDRFSAVSNRVDIGAVKNTFELYGFHYAVIEHPDLKTLVGVVTYSAVSTPAYRAGLRRGTCFIKVDDNYITRDGLGNVQALLQSGNTVALTLAEPVNGQWTETEVAAVSSTLITEPAVIQTKVFSWNGIKTGYLFYNGFTEKYDGSMLTAFSKMKQEGVSECIIDLRYNPGGSVSSSAKMAGMLTTIKGTDVYGIFQGNAREGRQTYSMERILKTSSSSSGNTLSALITNRLSLQRVFLLTSRATVSAAELLINNLKPYITVIQVGDTTLGKDEASFEISDYRTPRQVEWVIRPIIYKLLNANGKGGYNTGLVPAYQVNELSVFPLPDLGSTDDVLIHKALQLIYGNATVEEHTLRKASVQVTPVYGSAAAASLVAPAVELPGVH